MILYKYTTRAAMKAIMKDAVLRVQPLTNYNDPFESVPAVSDESRRVIAESALLDPRAQRQEAKNLNLTVRQFQLRLQNDPKFKKALVDKLLSRLSKWTPVEFALSFQKYFSDRFELICLSKNPASILMWSHYAESHYGYVFAIDTSLWKPADDAHRVTYSDLRVQLSSGKEEELITVLTTKFCDWRYEEEYRIIRRASWTIQEERKEVETNSQEVIQQGRADYLTLEPHQIKWICAGLKTPKEDIKDLRGMLKDSRFQDAQVYKASLNQLEFGIDLPEECTLPM